MRNTTGEESEAIEASPRLAANYQLKASFQTKPRSISSF